MKKFEKVSAKIKYLPEDFIVEEIGEKWICKISKEFEQPEIKIDKENQKDFFWCELEKKNIDHFTTMKELTYFLKKRNDEIGYAGTKDKKAWTSQRISIFQPNLEILENFKHERIILKNFKWNKRKIKLGYLDANHFKVILRDLDKKDSMKISNKIRSTNWFPNYFGPQRFGAKNNNVKIGKLILKRKFKEAIEEISNDNPRQKENIQRYLSRNPEDYIGAIKKSERKIMLMYVNAVQSKIFNEILETALEENLDFTKEGQKNCLLVGYKSRFYKGRLGEIEQQILKQQNLELEDFDIKEIPYLRIKGSFRKAITQIEDLEIEISEDEFFEGSKKIHLEFTLPSGVYATTFLENFFDLENIY